MPIYFKQARLCSFLLHTHIRKCEISKALNLSFSNVWRITLSEQKIKERAKINQLHWARWFHVFTARPRTLSPRGTAYPKHLPDLCLYFRRFREVLFRESNQICLKKKNLNRRFFSKKVITYVRTSNRCTTWHMHRWASKMAYFTGDWTMWSLQGYDALRSNSFVDKVILFH